MSTYERYKNDIARLLREGRRLAMSLQQEADPKALKKIIDEKEIKNLPNVRSNYEAWYSEALACLVQLLPDRVDDFVSYYKPKSTRKEILHSNYTMSDYLRGTTITRYGGTELVVGPTSALHPLFQQTNIVEALSKRFESTLYDIKTLVQADLFDNELHAAGELNKKGFHRAAGAIAGVVLEGHLKAICERHGLTVKKKNPSISDLNDALKAAETIEISTWRFIQHLADVRNKCDHKKDNAPVETEIHELIEGTEKITKTIL